jgi:hypothetical protein
MYASKDIENRGLRFPRNYRGRVLLHASKWWNQEEIRWDMEDANLMWRQRNFERAAAAPTPTMRQLEATRGHVIGTIEIADYVEQSDSPWFSGDLGIVVRNPVPFTTPIPLKGMLGLFTVDTSTSEFQKQLQSAFDIAA